MSDIANKVAKRILFYCNEKDISINKLAMLSGLTQSTVESIINGKSKNPRLETLHKICNGLDITMSEFLDSPEFDKCNDMFSVD